MCVVACDEDPHAAAQLEEFIKENIVGPRSNHEEEAKYFTFRKILPPPDDRMLDTTDGFNGRIEGVPSGFDWAVDNWGTKWDAYDQDVYDVEYVSWLGAKVLTIRFNTAWSPPKPVIEALGRKYDRLEFSLHFEESGAGYIGDFEMRSGEMVLDETREVQSFHDRMNCGGG